MGQAKTGGWRGGLLQLGTLSKDGPKPAGACYGPATDKELLPPPQARSVPLVLEGNLWPPLSPSCVLTYEVLREASSWELRRWVGSAISLMSRTMSTVSWDPWSSHQPPGRSVTPLDPQDTDATSPTQDRRSGAPGPFNPKRPPPTAPHRCTPETSHSAAQSPVTAPTPHYTRVGPHTHGAGTFA